MASNGTSLSSSTSDTALANSTQSDSSANGTTPRSALDPCIASSTTPGHTFADLAALYVARDAWCADRCAAAGVYGPIGEWVISAVTDLSNLFCAEEGSHCNAACSSFNDDISAWDTSSVESLHYTFRGATAYNQPLTWNVQRVTSLYGTFMGATAFNQPLDWSTENVESIDYVFNGASGFDQPLTWNVGRVRTMRSAFDGASAISDANQIAIHEAFSSNPNWACTSCCSCGNYASWHDGDPVVRPPVVPITEEPGFIAGVYTPSGLLFLGSVFAFAAWWRRRTQELRDERARAKAPKRTRAPITV